MTWHNIHLRGEETLHLSVELDDHGAALLQRIARMTEDLRSGYEPHMTIDAASGDGSGHCPSCGADE